MEALVKLYNICWVSSDMSPGRVEIFSLFVACNYTSIAKLHCYQFFFYLNMMLDAQSYPKKQIAKISGKG